MNATGKKARKRYGSRAACKRRSGQREQRKHFGKLPVSASKGNAEAFLRDSGWTGVGLEFVAGGGL